MLISEFVIAIGAAQGLGLLIGLERQFGQHPAGVRTNALVSAGAAIYVLLARSIDQGSETARVAAQIVSGIGFLGGGVILREGLTVRGLTTAATLWCSAAVGALCGTGLIREAGIATGAILAINCLLNPFSRWIDRVAAKRAYVEASYRIKVVCAMADEHRIRHMLTDWIAAKPDMILRSIGIHAVGHSDHGMIAAEIETHVRDEHALQEIVAMLNADDATFSSSWEKCV